MTPYRHLAVVQPTSTVPYVNPNLYDEDGCPRGPVCRECETPILEFEMELSASGEIGLDITEGLLARRFCLPCRIEARLIQKAVGR